MWQPCGAILAPAPTSTMEPATPTIARSMRARARVALVSIALSASFGIGGCAAIDDLKASISRWFDTANFPDEGVGLPGTAPEVAPVVAPEKIPKESPRHQRRKSRRRVNYSLRRPLCFLPRNHRSPIPPGRQGRTNRGAIRAARLHATAHSVSRSATARNFFALRSAPNAHPEPCPLEFKSPEARAVKRETEEGIGDCEFYHPIKGIASFSMVWPRGLFARRR